MSCWLCWDTCICVVLACAHINLMKLCFVLAAETFETMDESFAELAQLLQFRDKEKERVKRAEARKEGKLSTEDKEMDAWDREMKGYLFERKVKATDRTKTPEEVAKEEAERLHALESKRLARMAGDFLSEDEFSDVSDDEAEGGKRKRARKGKKKEGTKKKKSDHSNPEELRDSEDESAGKKKEEHEVRFTADGLVYVDKVGNVVGKVGEEEDEEDGSESEGDDSDGVEGSGGSSDEEGHRDLDASDEDASAAGSGSSEDDDSGSDEAAGTRAKKQKAKMRAK